MYQAARASLFVSCPATCQCECGCSTGARVRARGAQGPAAGVLTGAVTVQTSGGAAAPAAPLPPAAVADSGAP